MELICRFLQITMEMEKQMSLYSEMAPGICKEARQDSQAWLLAQVLINLFRRLICRNQKEKENEQKLQIKSQ